MLILPAIDLRGGQCVRLQQGDYAQRNRLRRRPRRHGAPLGRTRREYLHLVDLDGAREGRPVNGASVRAIVRAAGVPCQLGGGLRSDAHVEEALGWGVTPRRHRHARLTRSANGVRSLCRRFPGRIAVGIDARDGRVAIEGWLEASDRSALELARQCAEWGAAAIIYTDISRDGMLEGPNVEATAELAAAVGVPVIASGGVTTLDDVGRLAQARPVWLHHRPGAVRRAARSGGGNRTSGAVRRSTTSFFVPPRTILSNLQGCNHEYTSDCGHPERRARWTSGVGQDLACRRPALQGQGRRSPRQRR